MRARELTAEMLTYIKSEAKNQVHVQRSFGPNSAFVARLRNHYLKEYLKEPSMERGRLAIESIGAVADPTNLDKGDRWEKGIPGFTVGLPAATKILTQENRQHLEFIDGNVLLGTPAPGATPENDFLSDGPNVSQLMHWATGVKYSGAGEDLMRAMFVGYEIFHLEGWSQFGLDSINDLIAEEQGRLFALKLSAGAINNENLERELLGTFAEARAWVGSLVRARMSELDNVVTSERVLQEPVWQAKERKYAPYWGGHIFKKYFVALDPVLGGNMTTEEVTNSLKQSPVVSGFIEIYALVEESKRWEQTNKPIQHDDNLKLLLTEDPVKTRMKQIEAQWTTTPAP